VQVDLERHGQWIERYAAPRKKQNQHNLSATFRISSSMTHGFKEWALICQALGEGAQSIILRKGGIAEGRAGFRFAHEDFLLFPTFFHEQLLKTTLPGGTAVPSPRADEQIEVRYRARVEWTRELTDPAAIALLAPFHCWREEVIEERFRYDAHPGINLAWVRMYRLSQPFVFPFHRSYGGCRSWVELPALPPETESEAVLDDATNRARQQVLLAKLEPVSERIAAGAP
jgi:hypothetical protein